MASKNVVKFGDYSTWKIKQVEVDTKPEKKKEEQLPPPKPGVIRLPVSEPAPEVPPPRHSTSNPNFQPRQAWDGAGREKYVIKYPEGYDPVT
eukprot:CAMPEP_0197860132 /NCGR_PEP_ID=MMETSP1438-20131217/35293_1 /TAXON_ID=1461541 /ORGANISM="Pterosperma sp., Strain CCMP1384" /LENGTH=91 /DNA_ID=CAMNT_0043476895 /DNA_START=20 /DNA_END=291 /DNA_ORIENTATION=-